MIIILKKKKKLKKQTAHLRKSLCSKSFVQASLHAAHLSGFPTLHVHSLHINASAFKNRGTSLYSPISNRLLPPPQNENNLIQQSNRHFLHINASEF